MMLLENVALRRLTLSLPHIWATTMEMVREGVIRRWFFRDHEEALNVHLLDGIYTRLLHLFLG